MGRGLLNLTLLASILFVSAAHATNWSTQTHDVYPGDFNADGRDDLLVIAKAEDGLSGIFTSSSGQPSVQLQSWGSAFLGIDWHNGTYKAHVGDFNGDNRADVLLQRTTTGTSYVLRSNSEGRLTAIHQSISNWDQTKARIAIGDFNGDGRADVFLQAAQAAASNYVFHATSAGQFASSSPNQTWPNSHLGFKWSAQNAHVYAGDFNGDGRDDLLIQAKPDIALIDYEIPIPVPVFKPQAFGLTLATSSGQFSAIHQLWSRKDLGVDWSPNAAHLVIGDFNGDQRDDVLLVARAAGQSSYVVLSASSGQLSSSPAQTLSAGAFGTNWSAANYRMIAADFNGDGRAELYRQSTSTSGTNDIASFGSSGAVSAVISHNAPAVTNGIGYAPGRVAGAFAVSSSGAATYRIPIWTPPGPRGIQPSLALTHNSEKGTGILGVGWSLSGLSSITRCVSTPAEDGAPRAVALDMQDRFCIDGNKLRVTSGAYGAANSIYQTQIANFARITAGSSLQGSGPISFLVEGKEGLIYEYGGSDNSRVTPAGTGTTVYSWLLSKVRDRSGNSYTVTYDNDPVNGTVPATIQWGPTTPQGSTYEYRAKFNYSTKTNAKDFVQGAVAGLLITNKWRLDSIHVGYSAAGASHATKRQYILTYESSPTTSLSRLDEVKECAATTADCLFPTQITYQNGAAGVASSPAGVLTSTNPSRGRYDFNGDGRNDLAYVSGGTWKVRLSIGSGFAPIADETNIPSSAQVVIHRFLAAQKDGFLFMENENWSYVGYNGSSITKTPTSIPAVSGAILTDNSGDGLADIVWVSGNSVMRRLNTTTGSATVPNFSSTVNTAISFNIGSMGGNVALLNVSNCPLARACDVNGDGRADLAANVTSTANCTPGPGGCTPTQTWYDLLSSGAGYVASVPNSGLTQVYLGMHFNDDACIDKIVYGTSNLRISGCKSGAETTVSLPAAPALLMDWDADGRTDILVNNNEGTFGVYLSRGVATGPFLSLLPTNVPYSSSCNYFVLDIDGDSLDDLACVSNTSPSSVSYYFHSGGGSAGGGGTFATHVRDLISSITDGYGFAVDIDYISTASSSYTKGSSTELPLVDHTGPMILVGRLTISNGIGGTYTQTYTYKGARRHGRRGPLVKVGEDGFGVPLLNVRGEWAGFEEISVVDSRTNQKQTTTYEQLFPLNGMVKRVDHYQSDETPISSVEFTNLSHVFAAGSNYRAFPYVHTIENDRYEVGGAKNGEPITNIVETFDYSDFTYGNVTSYSSVVTNKDAGSGAEHVNQAWTTTVTTNYQPVDTAAGRWCVALPTDTEVTYSSTFAGATSVTRRTEFVKDLGYLALCRIKERLVEPDSLEYRVTETFGFDDPFGNISSVTVVGREPYGAGFRDMDARTTDLDWDRGRFLQSVTDPSGAQTGFVYNHDVGTLQKVVDPNSTASNVIETAYLHDPFSRPIRQTHPDGTYTTASYQHCLPNCVYGTHKVSVKTTQYDKANAVISDHFSYLDSLERPIIERARLVNGTSWDGSYQWSEVQYDALGRLTKQYTPCSTTRSNVSCRNTTFATSVGYDAISRVSQISRPKKESDITAQITEFDYEGRVQRVTDPLGKQSTRITDVVGSLRETIDANNYAVKFAYDAAGTLTGVTGTADNVTRTLLDQVGVEYGIRPFHVQARDSDLGLTTKAYNSLGELVAWTDAKDQLFSATYDELSRPRFRYEPQMTTEWRWGTSKSLNNVGQLESVRSTSPEGLYVESYSYDNRTRLQSTKIELPGIQQITSMTTRTNPTRVGSIRSLIPRPMRRAMIG